MKIAVPTREGRVDDHFGHCAYYTIFDIIDGKVTGVSRMASPEGCGCKSGIAPVLRQMGVVVMLAGNMGQGAKNVLEAQRIEVIRGCSGDVEELVAAYLAGNVKDNGEGCNKFFYIAAASANHLNSLGFKNILGALAHISCKHYHNTHLSQNRGYATLASAAFR